MTVRPDPNELIAWRGVVIDRRTAAAIVVCERSLGYQLTLIKAHAPGESAVSASTHTGLGVVDFAPYDWENKLRVLKEFFAAYFRTEADGPWSPHIHAASFCIIGMDPLAVAQIRDYDMRPPRNGLSNHALDRNPWRHPDEEPFDFYAYWYDGILEQRIRGLRARLKTIRERMSALRARRQNIKAQIAAARDKQTYLH